MGGNEGNNGKNEENVVKSEKRLTVREEKFCWAYLVHLNAGKAAAEAGYSYNTRYEIGHENLKKPHIQERIAQIRSETAGKYDVTKESLIQELATIAKFDLREAYNEDGTLKPPSDWSEEVGKALAGVEVDEIKEYDPMSGSMQVIGYTKKVKRDSKIAAIAELNKMLGHNAPEKREVTGKDGSPLALIFNPSGGNEPLPTD